MKWQGGSPLCEIIYRVTFMVCISNKWLQIFPIVTMEEVVNASTVILDYEENSYSNISGNIGTNASIYRYK